MTSSQVAKQIRILIYDIVMSIRSDMNIHDRWNRLYFEFYKDWNMQDLNNIPEIKNKAITKLDYIESRPQMIAKLYITCLRIWCKSITIELPKELIIFTDK